MKGLNIEQEKIVKNILKEFKDYNFFCYGSRVKGHFVKSSDLDILIKGTNPAPVELIGEIKEIFYDSKLPFIVNIVDFYDLDKDFYERIKSDLVKI